MKIFLTGGSGFIGRNVGRHLLEGEHEVLALARSETAAGKVEAWGGTVVEGSLSERGAWQERVPECDAVVHVAAMVGDWGKRSDFLKANVEGTRYVAESALGGVEKFVHVSSVAAYGGMGRFDENEPPRESRNPYSASKALAEMVVDEFVEQGLNAVHARISNVYGPNDPYFVPRLMEQARTGRFVVIGDGCQPANFIHVDDVAGALIAALRTDTEPGERFLVIDPDSPTIVEAVEAAIEALGLDIRVVHIPKAVAYAFAIAGESLGRLIGRRPMVTYYAARGLSGVRIYDNKQTIERLSWSPQVDFREGVAATAASFLEQSEL